MLALQTELLKYHELSHINDHMLYAVELMADNHAEMCNRLGVSVDHPHFVCANAMNMIIILEPNPVESLLFG